mgnify:CR=1 FL=1
MLLRRYVRVDPTAPSPQTSYEPENRPWVSTASERASAARVLGGTFAATALLVALAGALALHWSPVDDVAFAGLDERIDDARDVTCLRVGRRADYAIVFVGIGTPLQYLRLLLQLDRVLAPDDDALAVFSERMHKSDSMHCSPFDPPRAYEARCEDVALVHEGSRLQRYTHTRFVYANDHVEYAQNDRAALLGLDGSFRLKSGQSYFLTTTHLCFSPVDDDYDMEVGSGSGGAVAEADDVLQFVVDADGAPRAAIDDLVRFAPDAPASLASRVANCSNNSFFGTGVRLFPSDAANERVTWLSLSDTFLYQYDNPLLDRRRAVVEMGKACAEARTDVAHANDLYRLDCAIIDPAWCQDEASLPFRRLATMRMRLDLWRDGSGGALRVAESGALARAPRLSDYDQGLRQAVGRLAIMLLVAAVVFVRGNKRASSSQHMLEHALDAVHCRDKKPRRANTSSFARVLTDAAITAAALIARILVYAYSVSTLVADGLGHVVALEAFGLVASLVHFVLRYPPMLHWEKAGEAPLTKLGGPMSICDVASAVLLSFAEPPLLSNDEGRFAAVGRLLVGLLISIEVLTRCFFAVPACAVMARTVANDASSYKETPGYRPVLALAALLWALQGVVACATLSSVFVRPAAYSLSRIVEGEAVLVLPYTLLFGLLCAGLPTVTKVALRTVEHECQRADEE